MGKIERILTGDGQVVVDLPEHEAGRIRITINRVSADDVRIVIAPVEETAVTPTEPLTREEARQILAVAGKLGRPLPKSLHSVDPIEIPFAIPLDVPGSEVLVDEDRGPR